MMTKHYSQEDKEEEVEVELSKFEKLLQVCEIAREKYYQEKFQGKQNNITASVPSSSAPKDVGTSVSKPLGWVEQVPRRSRSKATRGEVSLSDRFCKLNLQGCVDDHDYLSDKEVPSSLCKFNGKRVADDHDNLNDKKVLLDVKGKKKLRNYYDCDDGDYEYSEKERPGKSIVNKNKVVEIAAPMPLDLENRIQEMEGVDVKLVIQKQIFASDTDSTQNRFSIPIKQIRQEAKDFLTENEISRLPITVPFIDPELDLTSIVIRKWNYSGKSSSYALSGPWSGISTSNNLRAGMVMQIWSFRVDGQLFLALVKVSRDNEQDHEIDGIANAVQQIHAEPHDQQHAMQQISSGNQADRRGDQGCSSYKSKI
ncbi:uncharacterized protein LOC141721639 [Apium graveolens]|uniref:uncharacterized protein LOC141721639 n=1 Tax=Apium graveolens TaxID=4045 RepID=UPI003D7A4921